MITTTKMYWLTRLDPVREVTGGFVPIFLLFVAILIAIALLMYCLGTFTGNGSCETFHGKSDEELENIHARLRRTSARCAVAAFLLLSASVAAGVLTAFLPTTREMAAIIMVPAVANNEKVQTVGNKLYDLAAEWLDELRPKKEAK